jgi:hypothetical protein
MYRALAFAAFELLVSGSALAQPSGPPPSFQAADVHVSQLSSFSYFVFRGGFYSSERSRLEHRGSHVWQGDTLVEHSKWKIRGIILTFERRLTFSDDESELNIGERIIGTEGEAEGSFKVSLR